MRDELKPGDYGYRRKRNIKLRGIEDNDTEIATGINWTSKRSGRSTSPMLDQEKPEEYDNDSSYQGELQNYDYDEIIEDDEVIESHELLQENERTEEIVRDNRQGATTTIGKKAINLEKLKVKKQQQEMERVTIYLDKNLLTILKMLKRENRINSYSQCIKDALEEYLTT